MFIFCDFFWALSRACFALTFFKNVQKSHSPLLSRLFYFVQKSAKQKYFLRFCTFWNLFSFFSKVHYISMPVVRATRSAKSFLRKKSARKNFFSLFFARFALFLKNIFLKINFFLRKGAFQAPASQKYFLSNHFCNSSCSHNRENLFLHFCVFSKKNIFFKKKFLFFTFFQKCTFEIFREKKYFLGISKKFCKVRASLLSRLFYFFLFCTKNNFFLRVLRNFFWKKYREKTLFFCARKTCFYFFS